MDKVYRIYISSCKRLLEREREILSRFILSSNHLPIQMEYSFQSDNSKYSIEEDKKKLEEADCVILILSYLYGEIIKKKIGNQKECPLGKRQNKNCGSCLTTEGCQLSFTQFEYEYAKLLNKPIVVIYNKNYKNDDAFFEANRIYKEQYNGEDCKKAYYIGQEKNDIFVTDIIMKHSYPYSNHEDFIIACTLAVECAKNLLKEKDNNENNQLGLIPYAYLGELKKKVKLMEESLQEVQDNGIEKIYLSQSLALEGLAKEKSIYLGINGEIQPIRILAIRGSSFTGAMGHDWTRFVLDEEFKSGMTINIEFVLSDYRNEKLIEERFAAFSSLNSSKEAFEIYKKGYVQDMETAQMKINEYRKSHPCQLFLHKEAKLPFRMVFIGKYLFLSTFLNNVKAADAPVMKIPCTSTLYKICMEYYEWIRDNAEKQD